MTNVVKKMIENGDAVVADNRVGRMSREDSEELQAVMAPKATTNKAKAAKARKVTKKSQAIELVAQNPQMTSGDLQKLFMEKLGMSKLGARTYLYNIRKN